MGKCFIKTKQKQTTKQNKTPKVILKKEVPSVLFEVWHKFELFDPDHIVSWLPYKLV